MPTVQPRALEALIEQFEAGHQPGDREISLLSDLSRSDAAIVRAAWPRLPVESREHLLERAADLFEESVELDFVELGRIALDDVEPSVRLRAIDAVAESTKRGVAEKLRDIAAGDAAGEVRTLASTALASFVVMHELGRLDRQLGEAIVATLRAAAEDREAEPELRAAAIESLGPLSAGWMPEIIAAAYESDEPVIRLAALRAMGDSADERWVDYVSDQFSSDDPEFRFEAAVAAGSIGSEEAVEQLGTLLTDDSPEVVLATIEALGAIGGQEAVDLLQAFAEDAPVGLEEAVKLALENAVENSSGRLEVDQDADEDYEE
jgi:HEAT repeat protein